MEHETFSFHFSTASSLSELELKDQDLFSQAIAAMQDAYAPYSHFKVGVSLKLRNGIVIKGSNQENMAYPSGLCAERVAMFAAAAQHPGVSFETMAIAANPLSTNENYMITPCGSCRQVMVEYGRLTPSCLRIIAGMPSGKITVIENAESLLPLGFFDAGLIS